MYSFRKVLEVIQLSSDRNYKAVPLPLKIHGYRIQMVLRGRFDALKLWKIVWSNVVLSVSRHKQFGVSNCRTF